MLVMHRLVPRSICARWLNQATAALDAAAAASMAGTAAAAASMAGTAADVATMAASAGPAPAARPGSLRLRAVPALAAEVFDRLGADGALNELLIDTLGERPNLLADQCWLRHQPAPARRRGAQTPHSWHQDGALGFPFATHAPPYPADALLAMLTCWIPLVACGRDAPSLRWTVPPPRALVEHLALAETAAGAHTVHALLDAGDALVFDGALLHATHADDAMSTDRTSIELRWLPQGTPPPRLAHEAVRTWPAATR